MMITTLRAPSLPMTSVEFYLQPRCTPHVPALKLHQLTLLSRHLPAPSLRLNLLPLLLHRLSLLHSCMNTRSCTGSMPMIEMPSIFAHYRGNDNMLVLRGQHSPIRFCRTVLIPWKTTATMFRHSLDIESGFILLPLSLMNWFIFFPVDPFLILLYYCYCPTVRD